MKHIIITGGTGEIGSHIVKSLINNGYYLSIVGRNKDNFNRLIASIEYNENIQFFKADVSNNAEVLNIFSALEKSNHNLYGLINAAGVQAPIGEFIEGDMNDWSNNLSINLLGTANMIHSFINVNGNNNKKIINFSGGGATSSRPNFSAYGISKTGIVKLTEILADELYKKKIDINAVAPGSINSGMLEEIINAGSQAGDEYKIALNKKNKGGDPVKNIVDLCGFLISSDSDGITGKLISAIWDDYLNPAFCERLRKDPNFCTLRRIDSINFDNIN